MKPDADEIIRNCRAYSPFYLRTAEEQMDHSTVVRLLDELRTIYLGKPYGMALGIALQRLRQLNAPKTIKKRKNEEDN